MFQVWKRSLNLSFSLASQRELSINYDTVRTSQPFSGCWAKETNEAAESTTMGGETREGKLKKIIRSTTDYLMEHDKKQLLELINEFRPRIGRTY